MPYIILDRDGVINFESKEYIKSPDEWHPIPGSLQAIAKLNKAGYEVIIATNQSGVSRGYYDIPTLNLIHEKLKQSLAFFNGKVTEIFYCPHHPDEHCPCRKPNPGMLLQIKTKYNLNVTEIFFIGDSLVDIQAAQQAGCQPLLVLTGNGENTLAAHPELTHIPHFKDLAGAVDHVLSQPA